MAAVNGEPRTPRGEFGKKLIATRAANDMNPGEFTMEHPLKVSERCCVSRGKTFKDHPREAWFVALSIGDGLIARKTEFAIHAFRHVAGEKQGLGVNVYDASRGASSGLLDEIRNRQTVATLGDPGLHALLQQPHAIDIRVKAKAPGGRTLVGVACSQCVVGCNGRGHECSDTRPRSGADVRGRVEIRGNPSNRRRCVVARWRDEFRIAEGSQVREWSS